MVKNIGARGKICGPIRGRHGKQSRPGGWPGYVNLWRGAAPDKLSRCGPKAAWINHPDLWGRGDKLSRPKGVVRVDCPDQGGGPDKISGPGERPG